MVLCNKHLIQMDRYGNTFNSRSDKSEINIHKDYAEITLYNRKTKTGMALIDVEDVDKVMDFRWFKTKYGYAARYNGRNLVFLHNAIMNPPEGYYADHIFHNKLDNRKSKLRLSTWQQNNSNKGSYSHNTSGHIGVHWDKDTCKWRSQIIYSGKTINLGRFVNIEDAIAARKEAEEKYFGAFAYKEMINC